MADIKPIGDIYELWKATEKRMAGSKRRFVRFEIGKLYYGDDENDKAVIYRCNFKTKDSAILEIVKVVNGEAISTGKVYKGKISIYSGYDWKSEYLTPTPRILIPRKGFKMVFGITAVHKVSNVKYPLVKKIKVTPAPFGL